MSEILDKLNGYLAEMAAPTTANVNRAIQLLDWMSDPKYSARIGKRKTGTNLTADKIISNVMAAVKKNLPQYKELKKINTPEEMKTALVALTDLNPSIKKLQFTEIMDAQQEILNVWNSLQSVTSRDKKKERDAKGDALGVKTATVTGSKVPQEKKRTNKDIDKELSAIEKILAAERKTPRYKKMLKALQASDPKSRAIDTAGMDKGRSLRTEIMDSKKVSQFLPDLDNSKVPGIAEAVKNIKEFLVIAYAEHRAYQDAEPAAKKQILANAKYLQPAANGFKGTVDAAKKGFGFPTGLIKKTAPTAKKVVRKKAVVKK